ncbi:MerR family transcriptional regulator [Romboutsia weinsteinii]|uniref:MerR family transcriptional regulator n=1 Tax=Romboutsia weinsteinii TaxID=2020949 RepID=A0A371J1P5_9FIRM|nr:MerR family transcriptional regulator [Romboutsia weinsteinii]RDY26732.1 MerR family transcriptional regulator [Romboutsia weinsteinii]
MKNYFSVGEAAKIANMTSETLRYYDRIDLVKPSRKDECTKYRYYTKLDIVRLNTIHALQQMDISLQEIKEALEYDDLERIVEFLTEVEKKADEKISRLQFSKSKIQLAKANYERKLHGQKNTKEFFTKYFSRRVIMLSDTMEVPTLDNLWNYLSHFYNQVDPSIKDLFTFEDLAGIYTQRETSRLFAVCISHADIDGLKVLPSGTYLCADCTEENRDIVLGELMKTAKKQYNVNPEFTVQLIVVSGILQWNYQIQIYLGY